MARIRYISKEVCRIFVFVDTNAVLVRKNDKGKTRIKKIPLHKRGFFYLSEGKQKCLCITFVIEGCVGFLLILLLFWIKFGETKQIVVALVATALKTSLSIAKTNSRFSGRKFCAGNICYISWNIVVHIYPLSAYKKVRPNKGTHRKSVPLLLSHNLFPALVDMRKKGNTFYQG